MREYDAFGRQLAYLLDRHGIVATHQYVSSQLTDILDEVVGERIVVIDDEQHDRGRSGGTEASSPGMITPMNLSQVLPIDVSVDLGRRDVDVTEHLLYRAQVGAPLQQVSRERVTQGVWGDVLGDPDALHVASQDLPRPHAGQRPSAGIEEEDSLPFPLL